MPDKPVRDLIWTPNKDAPQSIEDAIVQFGLDWTVETKPLYYLEDPEAEHDDDLPFDVLPVDDHFATVRSDNKVALGVVTRRYVPMVNVEVFSFLAEIFQSEMDFVAAGEFNGGRRVYVVMKIPSFIEVGGDSVGQYAFVHTSHDGKHAISVGMTPVRWICQNFVTANLSASRRDGRFISIRHSNRVDKKIEEARRMLDVTVNYYKQFKIIGDQLARVQVSTVDGLAYMEAILPIDPEQGERHAANIVEARAAIARLFAEGETRGNAPGSWWSLYNAAVEFADWYVPLRGGSNRLQRMLDDVSGFKTRAYEMALAGAEQS